MYIVIQNKTIHRVFKLGLDFISSALMVYTLSSNRPLKGKIKNVTRKSLSSQDASATGCLDLRFSLLREVFSFHDDWYLG